MSGIETLIVLAVASFHFAIVPWSKWAYEFMPDAMFHESHLKDGWFIRTAIRTEAFGKFLSIICLNAFNAARESLYQMFQKQCGRIRTVFLKGFHKTPAGEFVDGSILKKLLSDDAAVYQTGGGNKLYIHLNPLARIGHLLIRFGDILGIGRMDGHNAHLFEETVESGNGAGITALPEFDPENDQSGIRVAAAHIGDKLSFLWGMLVRVMVRASGAFTQGFQRAIKASFPTVDILAVGFVFDSGLGDAILLSVADQG